MKNVGRVCALGAAAALIIACGREHDGGHLVLSLGMSQAEVLAASEDLGVGFTEAEMEDPEHTQYRAVADRTVLRDLVVGQHLEFPRALVAYILQAGRICKVHVIPMTEGRCVLDGEAMGRVLIRSGFKPTSTNSFEAELRHDEGRWREINAAMDPDLRRAAFNMLLERSDGKAFLTVLPEADAGRPCFTSISVDTCRWRRD